MHVIKMYLLSGFVVSSAAEFIKLGSELILVHSSVFNSELHFIKFLGGFSGFHLEPLLGAGHVSTASVQVLNLDVVFIDSDFKLLNNL
jgi:hypothetical protein